MSGNERVPVISVVGKSGVGKTTALEGIIREFKRRGYRLGTVKHDAHGFEVDRPGKDSWRHTQAGSDAAVIAGSNQIALIRQLGQEMSLDEIVPLMGDVDIVLTEGFKRGDKPKIEVSRLECGPGLLCQAEELIAILADYPIDIPVPQFALEDAQGIVNLVEDLYLKHHREVKK